MSEMVERVARAMCNQAYSGLTIKREWMDESDTAKQKWRQMARAVVQEMREPTMPMLHAAYYLMEGEPECLCMNPGLYVEWKTMIDEALSGSEETRAKQVKTAIEEHMKTRALK